MRKVIGLIPLWDDERESYWMLPGYMKLIEQCGGLPMMLPMTDDEKMLCLPAAMMFHRHCMVRSH